MSTSEIEGPSHTEGPGQRAPGLVPHRIQSVESARQAPPMPWALMLRMTTAFLAVLETALDVHVVAHMGGENLRRVLEFHVQANLALHDL